MTVALITSAAYVESELEVQFGRLPPAFLPLKNKRMYEHQIKLLEQATNQIFLSIPEDFELDTADQKQLAKLNVTLIKVPISLSLGESVVYCVNIACCANSEIIIMHGDTLFSKLVLDCADSISVSTDVPLEYDWGKFDSENGTVLLSSNVESTITSILTGVFYIGSAAVLVREITRSGGSFIAGLRNYSLENKLSAMQVGEWFDFGHATMYHRSRMRFTTERSFNEIKVAGRKITKSGNNPGKILAEASWFNSLPNRVRIHCPVLLSHQAEPAEYSIEYIPFPTLADLFVYGNVSKRTWRSIAIACQEFLENCRSFSSVEIDANAELRDLLIKKTTMRLGEYSSASGLDLNLPIRYNGRWLPSIEQMVSIGSDALSGWDDKSIIMHGDFCFSNILYSHLNDLVKVIDPRGILSDGKQSILGPSLYDITKLYHSSHGFYDLIVAGRFFLRSEGSHAFILEIENTKRQSFVKSIFEEEIYRATGVAEHTLVASTMLLFFAMLPLHADCSRRQRALLANAVRLFIELDQRS